MEKTVQVLKKVNKNYKYFLYVVLGALVFSAFNIVATSGSQAQQPQTRVPTTTAPDTSASPSTTTNTGTPPSLPSTTAQQVLGTATGSQIPTAKLEVLGMSATIIDVAGGVVSGNVNSYIPVRNTTTGQIGYAPVYGDSGLSQVIAMTGNLYKDKPLSLETWASDLRERMSPTVEAQDNSGTYYPGQGYNLLSPVQGLWRAAANIVYIFYILIMVAVAFLIVFRNKLAGDQAINLFNALPSIIISLVLVYFSYPLSALFIDLITVGSGTVYGVLIGTDSADPNFTAPGAFLRKPDYQFIYNPDLAQTLSGNSSQTIVPSKDLQIDDKYTSVWQIFLTAGINPTTNGASALVPKEVPLSNILSNIINSITSSSGGIGGSLLTLVFGFAAFSSSLKLFFKLLQEYVILMFYPLAAPFLFLGAAIPGRTGSVVSSYFRRLLSASVAFILTYALFLIVIIISRSGTSIGDIIWVPPLLGYTGGVGLNGQELSSIARPLLAFALFLGIPPILEQVQNLISEPGQGGVGQAVAQSAKQGAGSILNTGRQLFSVGQGALLK